MKQIKTTSVQMNTQVEVLPVTSQLVARITRAHLVMTHMFDDCKHMGKYVLENSDGETYESETCYDIRTLDSEEVRNIDENVMSVLQDLYNAFVLD